MGAIYTGALLTITRTRNISKGEQARLGQQRGKHEGHDELQRARALHGQHGDADGHARHAAQHCRRAHHLPAESWLSDVATSSHHHLKLAIKDDLNFPRRFMYLRCIGMKFLQVVGG